MLNENCPMCGGRFVAPDEINDVICQECGFLAPVEGIQ